MQRSEREGKSCEEEVNRRTGRRPGHACGRSACNVPRSRSTRL